VNKHVPLIERLQALKQKSIRICQLLFKNQCLGQKKHWRVILVKSESTALRHFKVNPVLKMNATFQKQCDVKQGMLKERKPLFCKVCQDANK